MKKNHISVKNTINSNNGNTHNERENNFEDIDLKDENNKKKNSDNKYNNNLMDTSSKQLSVKKRENKIDEKDIEKEKDSHDSETKDIIDITVRFQRGALSGLSEREVLAMLGLVKNVTERIVVVDWDCKTIKPYNSAEEVVIHFVQKRFGFYIERYKKMLADTEFELKFWELLKACYDGDLPGQLKGVKNKAE